MSPGTRAACVGTHQVHEVVLVKETETCRGGTSIEGQRSLAEPIAAQEKEETLWADKERRLAELVLEEKAAPSPSTVQAQSVGPDVSAELSRMQGIIDNLQGELARLCAVAPLDPTADVNESMVSHLPHKKSRVAQPRLATTRGAPRTPLAVTGGHAQDSSSGFPPL